MKGKPTLWLDNASRVSGVQIVFVGGPHPYFWIGDREGNCFGTMDAEPLLKFVTARAENGQAVPE